MIGKWLVRLALTGVMVYVAVGLAIALCQRQMIYVPPHYPAEVVSACAAKAGLERWRNASGQPIGMRRQSSKQPARGQLLVVYGNGSWSVGCAHYADGLQSVAAFDLYILEYPGYADRVGSPSQQALFSAADEALLLLNTNRPVYVLGESLGTGVAAYLAGSHPDIIAGLILLSPYNQLTGVAQHRMPLLPVRLLLLDRFPSEDYLRQYQGPVGVVVDGRDDVVPEKFGRRLYDGYAGPKRLWEFPNGHHIAIDEPPARFWAEVVDFWRTNGGAAKLVRVAEPGR